MPAKKLDPIGGVNLPSMPVASAGWGARIENLFIRGFGGALITLSGIFPNIIAWGVKNFIEDMEREAIDEFTPLFNSILNNDAVPSEYKQAIQSALSGRNGAALLMIAGAAIGLMSGGLGAILQPLFVKPQQAINKFVRPTILDPSLLLKKWYRFPEDLTNTINDLSLQGYPDSTIQKLVELARPRLNANELIRLGFRFPNELTRFHTELQKLGWEQGDIEAITRAYQGYPAPDDLIRFAVRDVFNDAIVQKYGYDEDLPAQFEPEMLKAGYAPGYGLYYWRAHWQLPSINNVIDMFRRSKGGLLSRPVDENTVDEYLRINDYPVFWRDRIKEITYELWTRVDIRRLIDLGIISKDRALNEYRALGYDTEHAQALVDLATTESKGGSKDLTQAAIVKAYKTKQFSRVEALDGLTGLGYDEDEANLILDLSDYDEAQKLLQEDIDRIEYLYVNGAIDDSTAMGELGQHNMNADQIRALFDVWEVRRKAKISLPTDAELQDFYLNNIITEDQYRQTLILKNYDPNRIAWTMARLAMKQQALAAKEQQAAIDAQQKLALSSATNEYNVARTDIDVQIATINVQIADLKVAIFTSDDADQKQAAKEAIVNAQDQIAKLNLQKAQLTGQFAGTKAQGSL